MLDELTMKALEQGHVCIISEGWLMFVKVCYIDGVLNSCFYREDGECQEIILLIGSPLPMDEYGKTWALSHAELPKCKIEPPQEMIQAFEQGFVFIKGKRIDLYDKCLRGMCYFFHSSCWDFYIRRFNPETSKRDTAYLTMSDYGKVWSLSEGESK